MSNGVDLPGDWPGKITEDSRGRLRIYLGRSRSPVEGWRAVRIYRTHRTRPEVDAWVHPAANTGGYAWLPRFVVWRETGHVLRPDEHVHHECRHPEPLRCVDPGHFRVVTPQFHGRLHAYATLLFRVRDAAGRWAPGALPVAVPDPEWPPYPVARKRAVITSGRTPGL